MIRGSNDALAKNKIMSNKIILINVGLNVNGVPALSPKDVFNSFSKVKSLRGYAFNVVQSGTEATVSALCIIDNVEQALSDLGTLVCPALKQDAVAIWDVESGRVACKGWLVGPKALEWGGEFNGAFFLDLDGIALHPAHTSDILSDFEARGTDDNGELLSS